MATGRGDADNADKAEIGPGDTKSRVGCLIVLLIVPSTYPTSVSGI
jgi:hypothetical protein